MFEPHIPGGGIADHEPISWLQQQCTRRVDVTAQTQTKLPSDGGRRYVYPRGGRSYPLGGRLLGGNVGLRERMREVGADPS